MAAKPTGLLQPLEVLDVDALGFFAVALELDFAAIFFVPSLGLAVDLAAA